MKYSDQQKQEAIAQLRQYIPIGSTVYTVLRHQASSGMMRCISPIVIDQTNGQALDFSRLVSKAVGYKTNEKHGGLTMQGGGMDMGFELVYNLGRVLYPNGTLNHKNGGYSLVHRWI